MCLIYNSINYRRNVVGLEAVAGYSNAIVLFHAVATRGAIVCCLCFQSGQRRVAGRTCCATEEAKL